MPSRCLEHTFQTFEEKTGKGAFFKTFRGDLAYNKMIQNSLISTFMDILRPSMVIQIYTFDFYSLARPFIV